MKLNLETIPVITTNHKLQSVNSPTWKGLRQTSLYACVCWAFFIALVLQPVGTRGETVQGVENDDFDFDGLPGVQHDFKVFVHAGMEECFFQKLVQGAELHARFEVLKGGNKEVDFYIRDRNGEVVQSTTAQEGFLTVENTTEGVYAMCIDNVFDRYGFKIVYVYIVSVVMQEWIKYQAEIEKVNLIAANFSDSLSSVERSISEMRQSMTKSRFYVVRDWYLASSNLYYVGMWSMMQCGVIIFAAVGQVFALRRLFKTTVTTPTAKPRA